MGYAIFDERRKKVDAAVFPQMLSRIENLRIALNNDEKIFSETGKTILAFLIFEKNGKIKTKSKLNLRKIIIKYFCKKTFVKNNYYKKKKKERNKKPFT